MPLEIPEVVISRLPVYYRLLSQLQRQDRLVVSSQELGESLGVTPAQIRKDLSYFGRFGKQGRGYSVSRLCDELRTILGLEQRWALTLVGFGHLGRAIASYRGFRPQGFDLVAIYDSSPELIGTSVDGVEVHDVSQMEEELREDPPSIAIVAVPAEYAQGVIDALVRAGVRAILNYAPQAVRVPEGIHVQQIDPVISLQSMTYHLRRDEQDR